MSFRITRILQTAIVLLGLASIVAPVAARAETVPYSRMPASWSRGCNIYSAAQNETISRPPTRGSDGVLDFRNQAPPTATAGSIVRMELVIYVESCDPSAAAYPSNTGYLYGGATIDKGATITGVGNPSIQIVPYNGRTGTVTVRRIPLDIRVPANLTGAQTFNVSIVNNGKINNRPNGSPRYQCVRSPSTGRPGYNQVSDYAPCYKDRLTRSFIVNISPPPRWDYRYKEFSTNVSSTIIPQGATVPTANLPQHAPNTEIAITSRVRNDGQARGAAFQQRMEFRWLGIGGTDWALLEPAVSHTEFPADPSGTGAFDKTITRRFRLPADSSPGRSICFRARINNFTGTNVNGSMSPTSGGDWRYVGNGTAPSGSIRCLKVSGTVQTTCTLSANPRIVDAGGSSTLTWTSQNAASATLQGEAVPVNGSRAVTVTSPGTEYTLQVQSNSGATETCSVTVDVRHNRPFIRTNGSDVISGATFGLSSGACSTKTNSTSAQAAFIRTSGYSNNSLAGFNGFSSSQYATFASAEIGDDQNPDRMNNYAANNGSLQPIDGANVKDLMFANQDITEDGSYGYYYGTLTSDVPCLDTASIQSRLQPVSGSFNDLLAAPATFVRSTASNLTIPASTISNQKIIWVDGSVTITGSINYNQSSASYGYNPDGSPRVPFLMIIATGGISINGGGGGARTLDGLYVSLPVTATDGLGANSNSGRIDTCANMQGVGAFTWPANGTGISTGTGSCNQKLTINGSLIARRILWKRTFGTLATPEQAVVPECSVNSVAFSGDQTVALQQLNQRLVACSSEFISFNPEAYFGPLYVLPDRGVGSIPNDTAELPPIY